MLFPFFRSSVCLCVQAKFLRVVAMIASLELQVPKLGGSCLTLFLGPLIFCSQQFTSKAAGICHHWEGSAVLSLFFLFCACTHTPCSMGFKIASEKDTIIFFRSFFAYLITVINERSVHLHESNIYSILRVTCAVFSVF